MELESEAGPSDRPPRQTGNLRIKEHRQQRYRQNERAKDRRDRPTVPINPLPPVHPSLPPKPAGPLMLADTVRDLGIPRDGLPLNIHTGLPVPQPTPSVPFGYPGAKKDRAKLAAKQAGRVVNDEHPSRAGGKRVEEEFDNPFAPQMGHRRGHYPNQALLDRLPRPQAHSSTLPEPIRLPLRPPPPPRVDRPDSPAESDDTRMAQFSDTVRQPGPRPPVRQTIGYIDGLAQTLNGLMNGSEEVMTSRARAQKVAQWAVLVNEVKLDPLEENGGPGEDKERRTTEFARREALGDSRIDDFQVKEPQVPYWPYALEAAIAEGKLKLFPGNLESGARQNGRKPRWRSLGYRSTEGIARGEEGRQERPQEATMQQMGVVDTGAEGGGRGWEGEGYMEAPTRFSPSAGSDFPYAGDANDRADGSSKSKSPDSSVCGEAEQQEEYKPSMEEVIAPDGEHTLAGNSYQWTASAMQGYKSSEEDFERDLKPRIKEEESDLQEVTRFGASPMMQGRMRAESYSSGMQEIPGPREHSWAFGDSYQGTFTIAQDYSTVDQDFERDEKPTVKQEAADPQEFAKPEWSSTRMVESPRAQSNSMADPSTAMDQLYDEKPNIQGDKWHSAREPTDLATWDKMVQDGQAKQMAAMRNATLEYGPAQWRDFTRGMDEFLDVPDRMFQLMATSATASKGWRERYQPREETPPPRSRRVDYDGIVAQSRTEGREVGRRSPEYEEYMTGTGRERRRSRSPSSRRPEEPRRVSDYEEDSDRRERRERTRGRNGEGRERMDDRESRERKGMKDIEREWEGRERSAQRDGWDRRDDPKYDRGLRERYESDSERRGRRSSRDDRDRRYSTRDYERPAEKRERGRRDERGLKDRERSRHRTGNDDDERWDRWEGRRDGTNGRGDGSRRSRGSVDFRVKPQTYIHESFFQ